MRCASKITLTASAVALLLATFGGTASAIPAVSKLTIDNTLSSFTVSGDVSLSDPIAIMLPITEQSSGSLTAVLDGLFTTVIDPGATLDIATASIIPQENHTAAPGFTIDPNLPAPDNHIALAANTSAPAAIGVLLNGGILGTVVAGLREVEFDVTGSSAISGTSVASDTFDITAVFAFLDAAATGIAASYLDPTTLYVDAADRYRTDVHRSGERPERPE